MHENEQSDPRDMRAIREVMALRACKGLDLESFLCGVEIGVTEPRLGGWISEAFDVNDQIAATVRTDVDVITKHLHEILENSSN